MKKHFPPSSAGTPCQRSANSGNHECENGQLLRGFDWRLSAAIFGPDYPTTVPALVVRQRTRLTRLSPRISGLLNLDRIGR